MVMPDNVPHIERPRLLRLAFVCRYGYIQALIDALMTVTASR
jgi:hypothetical protein